MVRGKRSTSKFLFRAYEPCDFESVISLWWESWHSSSSYVHHRPIEDWKARWGDLAATHKIVVIVLVSEASIEDEVVAFAALNLEACVLSQIFVAPRWKRNGLGRQLMAWVGEQCPDGFSLRTAADNGEAISFYEKAGLVQVGQSINDFNGKPELEYSMQ